MKYEFWFNNWDFIAWHLIPTIRFAKNRNGFFIALTFLKMDAGVRASRVDYV